MDAKDSTCGWLFALISLVILSLLVACRANVEPEPEMTVEARATDQAPEDDNSSPQLVIPAAQPDTETPAGVVDAFYTWYLDGRRDDEFMTSPYLTQRQIDAAVQARDSRGGADPFLLAQDVPAAIRVEEVDIGVATAQVVVHEYFSTDMDEASAWDLTLDLIKENDGWKIDRLQRGSPLTADGAVQLFFNWYFGYDASDGEFGSVSYSLAPSGNPLTDRAYRSSPYLASEFIARVDALLAESADRAPETDAPVHDPFLLATNHPSGFFVMTHEMRNDGAARLVPVHLNYGSMQTTVDVVAREVDGRWRIVDVQGELPDDATAAAQVVSLFSASYFNRWYAYAEAHGLPHVGEVDLAPFLSHVAHVYEESPYLSPTYSLAGSIRVAGNGDSIDPFFVASGVPARMDIEDAWVDGDHAEVRVLQRWYEGHDVRPLTVKLGRVDGRWLIEEVVPIADEMLTVVDPRAEMHPADVVRAFFSGYLMQGGYAGGAHRDNGYLSPAYAASVEYDVGYLRDLGVPVDEYDPILHSAASVIPGRIHVEVVAAVVEEELHRATVKANRVFEDGASLPLTIYLTREWDNRWTIQEVGAVNPADHWEPDGGISEALSLGMGMAYHYDWALAYNLHGEPSDPLLELLQFGMEAEGGMTFCTESPPLAFAVESIFTEPDGRRARMVVRTTEAHALLILELEKRDWNWIIVDQQCGDTPVGRAAAFYTSYFSVPGDRMVARAYARGDYLTADLIMTLDEVTASEGDTLTLAHAAPRWFEASAGPVENSAVVMISFDDGTRQEMALSFVLVDGRWLLSDVSGAE